MRLFIGIELPDDVKQTLYQLQAKLKNSGVKGSWKLPENMHLTLEFLGEIEPQTVPVLIELLSPAQKIHDPFTLHITGLGVFPSDGNPHTLWAALGGNTEALHRLRNDIHERLEQGRITVTKKPFYPHVTLASNPKITSNLLNDANNYRELGRLTVYQFFLFESKVDGGKRVYSKLYEFQLTK